MRSQKNKKNQIAIKRISDIFKTPIMIGVFIFAILLIFCQPVFNAAASEEELKTEELKIELRQKLEQLQSEINNYENKIETERQKADSLKREINIIDSQIKKTNLEIQKKSLEIRQLEGEITDRINQIKTAQNKIGYQKEAIAEYIRKIYEADQESILEIILQNNKLSDFFSTINSYESIHDSLKLSLNGIRDLKNNLEKEKMQLEEERSEAANLKKIQEYQKYSLQKSEKDKYGLLKETKGNEQIYQRIVSEKAKDLRAIRNQLYALEGFGISMRFEEAYNYAKKVSNATGIRPAFLLGVLKVESDWGSNLGKGNWRTDMYDCYYELCRYYAKQSYCETAEIQKNAFMSITSRLGLNPDLMPVSAEPYYGCGGAMGIAQFMPQTWLAYENRITSITGHNPPSPWDIGDGFAAAAIKLSNDGASSKTYEGERIAALKYLAGAKWQKSSIQWYWNGQYGVKYYEDLYQGWIDALEGR